jgi:hypothetical protein
MIDHEQSEKLASAAARDAHSHSDNRYQHQRDNRMSDDIGWMQPSAYHQKLMVGETPTSTLVPTGG